MFAVFLFWFLIFNFFFFFRAETPTKRAKTPTKQAKTPEMRFSCKTVNSFNTVINNISTIYSVSGHLNQTSSKSLKNTIGQKKTPQAKKKQFGLKFQPEQLRAEKAACGRPRYIYIYIDMLIFGMLWLPAFSQFFVQMLVHTMPGYFGNRGLNLVHCLEGWSQIWAFFQQGVQSHQSDPISTSRWRIHTYTNL